MSNSKPKSQRHVMAGKARHRRLLERLGADGYRQFQQAGYAAMKRKYGDAWAKACLAKAHETRRQWRIANPTPGEAAVALALTAAGYHVHADPATPWVWPTDRTNATERSAIREACIGPYYADFFLPMQALVIEVVGGVHCLTEARDAQRRQWLETQGLRVVVIDETTATTPEALAVALQELLDGGGGDETPTAEEVVRRRLNILDITIYGGWNESTTWPWSYNRRVSDRSRDWHDYDWTRCV